MDPAQWLADYRDRLERVAYSARAASASLREVGASASSPRGEVTMTVNAAGGLEHVALTPAARKLEADVLAALIVTTSREAQRLASTRMAEVMAGYLGEGDALAEITQHLPAGVVVR
jgi:DNA-binding protein YbaB